MRRRVNDASDFDIHIQVPSRLFTLPNEANQLFLAGNNVDADNEAELSCLETQLLSQMAPFRRISDDILVPT